MMSLVPGRPDPQGIIRQPIFSGIFSVFLRNFPQVEIERGMQWDTQ
jgi:hypothetical protein